MSIHSQTTSVSAFPNAATSDPTAVLHPETLTTIFQYVRCMPVLHEEEGPRFTPNWIVFTHACRRWRAIALSFPLLWDQVDVMKPSQELACMMLDRAARVPLRVYATSRHRERTRIRADLQEEKFLSQWERESLPRFGHIKTIVLDFELKSPLANLPVTTIGEAAPSGLPAAPLLESLKLAFGSSATMMLLLPSFKRSMPSLRHLQISDTIWSRRPRIQTTINLLDHFPSCPHLASLTLTSTPNGIPFSVGQLLQLILPSLPQLEDIRLDSPSDITEEEYRVLAELPKVLLPRLSSFYLGTECYCNSVIFEVVQYPPTTKVVFYCLNAFPPSVQVSASMSPIFDRLSGANGPPITDLDINIYDDKGYMVICAATQPRTKHTEIVLGGPSVDGPVSGSQVFQVIRPSLPLHNIRRLFINGFEDLFEDQLRPWVEFLCAMPLLDVLVISIGQQQMFLRILEACLENQRIFPRLRHLDIFEDGPWIGEIVYEMRMLRVLVEVARARRLAGNPIIDLDLNSGIIIEDDVLADLRQVIDDVRHAHVELALNLS